MEAWEVEATKVHFGNLDLDHLGNHIVLNDLVEEFLSQEDQKNFIVAPKGIGKTFLLKVKNKIYREKNPAYLCIPKDADVLEKLTHLSTSFSKEDLNKFEDPQIWDKIWQICLLCLILRNAGISMPAEIDKVIGDATQVQDILATLLNNRRQIENLFKLVPKILRPKLSNLRKHGINQVAVFIDNVDEAFVGHTGRKLRASHGLSGSNLSEQVWIQAQLGLISVVRNLCDTQKHVKIFASVRSEAYRANIDSTRLQLKAYATELVYTKSEVERIFENNIALTAPSKLAKSEAKNPLERFLGIVEINHRYVLNANNERRKEKIFDYIYRHTFGRPRDIVAMGKKISSIPVVERGSNNVLSDKINEVSAELFDMYVDEIVPFFEEEAFDLFCRLCEWNVLDSATAESIQALVEEETGFSGILGYLYRHGLIGVVKQGRDQEEKTQYFLPVGEFAFKNKIEVPKTEYFLMHSAMDTKLKTLHTARFYNQDNIIASEYPFYPPRLRPKLFHAHFGLQRDGVSILIPELAKTKTVIVVQEPNPKYAPYFEHVNKLVIQDNLNHHTEMFVIRDDSSDERVVEIFEEWKRGKHVCLYANDMSRFVSFIGECETISFVDETGTLLQSVKHFGGTFIYQCRRFFDVKEFAATVKRLNKFSEHRKPITRPVLTDRLRFNENYSLIASKDGKSKILVCNLDVESYGRLVYRDRADASMKPNEFVVRSKTKEEQDYFNQEARLILESTYRLHKLISMSREWKDIDRKSREDIYSLFFEIQIQRILAGDNRKVASQAYGPLSDNELEKKLLELCGHARDRYEHLYSRQRKVHAIDNSTAYITSSKHSKIFPSDEEFYEFSKMSSHFISSECVLNLMKLLEIPPSSKFKSIFVSYSYKDLKFAKLISDAMKKRGFEVFRFSPDEPGSPLESMMVKYIKRYDKTLFISSQNSIRSNACQRELTESRKKWDEIWEETIEAINIDEYFLTVEETDIRDMEKRTEYWKNIQMLRNLKVVSFIEFYEKGTPEQFEVAIDDLTVRFKNA